MKFGYTVKKDGVLYPAGAEVPEDIQKIAEMTDNVPDGALETNADGSVSAYDEDGNKVGIVDEETVERLQEEAGEAFVESEKPKRGRKSKEE